MSTTKSPLAPLWVLSAGLIAVALGGACSSSSETTTTKNDAGSGSGSSSSHSSSTSSTHHDGGGSSASSCPATIPCTGALTGGVSGSVSSCTVSGEDGVSGIFGEVTFHFSATSDGATNVTGSGNISTSGAFAVESYSKDAGLWNDMGAQADSLWSVSWTPSSGDASGTSQMTQCNGVPSPDETPSICQAAVVSITSIDACKDLHGTLALTIPAYMAAAEIGVQLSF